MIIRFCLYFIPFIGASISDIEQDLLGEGFLSENDQDVDGMEQIFIQWGHEEAKLEFFSDLVEGRKQIPPNFPHVSHFHLAAILHYTYNPLSLEHVVQVVSQCAARGVIVLNQPISTLSLRILRFRDDFTTLPAHVFGLLSAKKPAQEIIQSTIGQRRFNSVYKVELVRRIWSRLCISRNSDPESPRACFLDGSIWRLSDNSVSDFLRWSLLDGFV